jgi:hypothetical protein
VSVVARLWLKKPLKIEIGHVVRVAGLWPITITKLLLGLLRYALLLV